VEVGVSSTCGLGLIGMFGEKLGGVLEVNKEIHCQYLVALTAAAKGLTTYLKDVLSIGEVISGLPNDSGEEFTVRSFLFDLCGISLLVLILNGLFTNGPAATVRT
jgi:hypothetical protein